MDLPEAWKMLGAGGIGAGLVKIAQKMIGYKSTREAALDTRYQALIDEQQARIVSGEKHNEVLRDRMDSVLRINASAAEQVASLLKQLTTIQDQNATLQQQYATMQADSVESRAARIRMHEENKALRAEHAALAARYEARIADLERALNLAREVRQEDQRTIEGLRSEVGRLRTLMIKHRITTEDTADGQPDASTATA